MKAVKLHVLVENLSIKFFTLIPLYDSRLLFDQMKSMSGIKVPSEPTRDYFLSR